jgi:hypothetical protein
MQRTFHGTTACSSIFLTAIYGFISSESWRGGAAPPRRCRSAGGACVSEEASMWPRVRISIRASKLSTPAYSWSAALPPPEFPQSDTTTNEEERGKGTTRRNPSSRHRQWWPVRPHGESDQGRARASRSEPPEPSISSAHAVVMGRRHHVLHVLCAATR